MPPKVKAAKRVKQDAERVSHPVVEAPLPGTKELTGFLSLLPLEILTEVLVRCEPSGVTRLLATSKALTNIANENETTIYRKLYHNLLAKDAVGAHVIHSPVWKKGKALLSYSLSAPLPAAAVYSWKLQFEQTARYRPPAQHFLSFIRLLLHGPAHADQLCMQCRARTGDAAIVDIPSLRLSLCVACYAQNLVPKSDLRIYGLTAHDVLGIPTIDAPTVVSRILAAPTTLADKGKQRGYGRQTSGSFYSGIALRQLAVQKRGGPQELVAVAEIKQEDQEAREALISTATLLQGGRPQTTPFYHADGYGQRWLYLEFYHYVNQFKFGKRKHLAPPHPKGYRNHDQLTKRPVEELLSDYAQLVREHQHDFPDIEDAPFFLPAARPGPSMPRAAAVAAFRRLMTTPQRKRDFDLVLTTHRSVRAVKILQQYVLNPTAANYDLAAEILDDVRLLINRSTGSKLAPRSTNDDRFDAKEHKQRCEAHLKTLKPYMRTITKARIDSLVQLGDIVGQPWSAYTAGSMIREGGLETSQSQHWQKLFFGSGSAKKFLVAIYLATRDEGHITLGNAGARTSNSSSFFKKPAAYYAYRLSPSAFHAFRARQLSSRFEHSLANITAEEEAEVMAKKLEAGTISGNGFIAAILESEEPAECLYQDYGSSFCADSCWIAQVSYEHGPFDDSDYESDFY